MQCDLFDTMLSDPSPVDAEPRAQVAQPARPHSGVDDAKRKRSTRRSGGSCARASDAGIIARLQVAHADYNETLFGGELGRIRMRISRRMKNRLGHYMVADRGNPAEIALSFLHLERDPWDDVLHTLVHEMVHQWQDLHGLARDHGTTFRAKAREVGISARATRPAAAATQPRLAARVEKRRKP